PDQDALVVDIGGIAPGKAHPSVTEGRPELPNLAGRDRVDHPAEVRNADISDRIRRLYGEEVAAVPELRVGLLGRTRSERSRPGGPIQLAGEARPVAGPEREGGVRVVGQSADVGGQNRDSGRRAMLHDDVEPP